METIGNNNIQLKMKRIAKIKKELFVLSILILPIISFLVFWVYVNLDSFLLAFEVEDYSAGTKQLVFSLQNFKYVFEHFFKESDLLMAFRNTCIFFGTGLLIVFPISVLMAYFVYKKIFMYKFLRIMTYLPNIITSAALVVLFKHTFSSGGPYEWLLYKLGKEYVYPFTSDNGAILMLVVYNIIFGLGGNMIVLGGAMNSISVDVLDAGNIDGCNWLQELVLLILPMIWPTISTIILLGCAGFLGSTGPILAMTKGEHNTETLSYILYCYATGVGGKGQNYYLASAIGLVMTIIAFPLVLVLRRVLNRIQEA